jgi:hypothetical protein
VANTPYTLFTQQAAGPTLTAGTAASMLVASSPASGQVRNTIPAGWLNTVGAMIIVDANGTLSTAATPGTGSWSLYFGSTAIWNSTAITLPASMSTWPWDIHLEFVVRSVGATTAATLYGTGELTVGTAANASSAYQFTPGVGASGFDSTVPNVCDLWFTESLTTATLICQQARVTLTNPNW